MKQLKEAIKVIEKADWETTLQMIGYLYKEQYLKGIMIASIKLATEKELTNFITFFSNDKLKELSNLKFDIIREYER